VTEQQVIAELKRRVVKAGSMRAYAHEVGVTASYICDLVHARRAPGPSILGPMGLKKVVRVSYERVVE
jgi:hypothetical protein